MILDQIRLRGSPASCAGLDIDKAILKNIDIDIDRKSLRNINIDIDIDIDKGIIKISI